MKKTIFAPVLALIANIAYILDCSGYQNQTFSVTIIQGQTTEVTIAMVRV